MQALPILLPPEHPALESCNLQAVLARADVPLRKLQSMPGNGMNAACVGKSIFYALASTKWQS